MRAGDAFNYAVAGLLLLASVPLYRYIIQRGHADDQPAQSLAPPVVVPLVEPTAMVPIRAEFDSTKPPLQPGMEGGVQCWHGHLLRQTGGQWVSVLSADGRRVAQCEIQVEPAHPQDYEASAQMPSG